MAAAVETASSVASSRLTYLEARSAFARMRAGRRLTADEQATAVERFEAAWVDTVVLEVTARTVAVAAELAERHVLRAYDALHLGAAIGVDRGAVLATWDADLHAAGRDEGLSVLPERLGPGGTTSLGPSPGSSA